MASSRLRNKVRQLFYRPAGNKVFKSVAEIEKAIGNGIKALSGKEKDDGETDKDKEEE